MSGERIFHPNSLAPENFSQATQLSQIFQDLDQGYG
jgi:hypothetical protein